MGLSAELLAESSMLYDEVTAILLKKYDNKQSLVKIITQRFHHDLVIQIGAYSLVQQDRSMRFQHIVEYGNVVASGSDFILFATHQLMSLPDVCGITIGFVEKAGYRHLSSLGNVIYSQLNTAPAIELAWHNELATVITHVTNDSPLSCEEHSACVDMGVRAMGIWLGRNTNGAVGLSLMVCSQLAGFFSNKDNRQYWQSIINQISITFELLERRIVAPQHFSTDGAHFRRLLKQGKVVMHYQPIINPATGYVVKVEALARLIDGDNIIPPSAFLPCFGAPQLRDLFDIGLAHVLRDMHAPELNQITFTINLPPEAMRDLVWLQGLPKRLATWKVDVSRIGFEIIESAIADDDAVMDTLQKLRTAGYAILLDDVGTGESSLLRLATLPISGIKIDQGFVRALTQNFERLDLVLSLIQIAEQRGLECVAEGVETMDIVDALGSLGRVLLQGYALAKPMPVNLLNIWMRIPTHQQAMNFPRTLSGWYSRHVARLYSVRQALCTIPDMIDVQTLTNAELCPLHTLIQQVGGDAEIIQAHHEWHKDYADFVEIAKKTGNSHQLWHAMDVSKQTLRSLIERKLRERGTEFVQTLPVHKSKKGNKC
jgi:EAL domain-containing protein (putative c-di-GMP-specific phosphodiesterase class I)